MKLLLDEMWPPSVAVQLRRRGHDVVAVAERAALRGQADTVIFSVAQGENRAIVTENVPDYRALALEAVTEGHTHSGIIYTLNKSFPRGDRRTAGRLVRALDALLRASPEQRNLEWWLSA